MVTRVATVAAHAVRITRVKIAGSELSSSSAPWNARSSSASGSSVSSVSSSPPTPRRAARAHT
eukprot:1017104-Prymnesium_polylepis.1